jgi:hypothetical protein
MTKVDLVRPSRDGDQFHYHWAARQCLALLNGTEDLVAVTIEGASTKETTGAKVDEGDEVIDVALYFGSEELQAARLVHYFQLKHSTRQAITPWTASGLKKTISGFASRYTKLAEKLPGDGLRTNIRFTFLTNRPLAAEVQEALADLATGAGPRHSNEAQLLTNYAELKGIQVRGFFELFTVEAGEPDLWSQRNLLSLDAAVFLADADYDAHFQLKELVTRRALSESAADPSVRRHDVLRALKVTEDQLFPAPRQIELPSFELGREQDERVLQTLLTAAHPVIIHADGGVGKSLLARRLATLVPRDSVAVVYDCFGDGLYRNSLNLRHRHIDALVQLANEMAARGLCHPLIPTRHADVKQLMRAFHGRLSQAVMLLRARSENASLCLIIDAADNARMAADERGEVCFVGDLIRVPLPVGVRLAFTCRTHRLKMLCLPPNAVEVKLDPFTQTESARHLRHYYPSATPEDIAEFALLSSSNPRVQALALAQQLSLHEMLRRLGPTPTTVDRAIEELLNKAIDSLKDRVGAIEAGQIEIICQGLAVLRPLVPIPILSRISGTSDAAIRSFALDLGRPLLVKGESLHFLDEPAETWFRESFQPDSAQMEIFLQRLRPLAAQSAYVAALLPQLLLAAGMLDELVELALSDEGLPVDNPLERRDVELQRLMFALKACLSGKRYLSAAKLAMRAGGESAAESRQNKLVQENTDLAACLLSSDRVEELVSRRSFSSTWMGSSQAYYAGLLAGRPELTADAASRLRMAIDWLYAWARLPDKERHYSDVSDADRAELTLAILRVEGPEKAADFLRRWSHKSLAFNAGRRVAARLLDLGLTQQLDSLFVAAGNNVWLLLAIAMEAADGGHVPPATPLQRLLRLLANRRVVLSKEESWDSRGSLLAAVQSAIVLALKLLPHDARSWSDILHRYLPDSPPSDLVDRFGGVRSATLRAYALHAALDGRRVNLVDLAHASIRGPVEESEKGQSHNSEASAFRRNMGAVLDFFSLSAEATCGRIAEDVSSAFEEAQRKLQHAESYQSFSQRSMTQAAATERLVFLREARIVDGPMMDAFLSWIEDKRDLLWPRTLISVCRLAARTPGLDVFALELASYTFTKIELLEDEHAESRANNYQELARAILPLSKHEASAYFDRSIEIASRIGDENISRWAALLFLGKAAGNPSRGQPMLAYKFARAAELTYAYVSRDKHFDWRGTMDALAVLCGPSALAISSRWRDRRFGNFTKLLPLTVEKLVQIGQLPSMTAVALAGIDAKWSRADDVDRAIGAETDVSRRRALLGTAFRYMRLQRNNRTTWLRLKALGEKLDVELLDIARLCRAANDDATEKPTLTSPAGTTTTTPEQKPDWNLVFSKASFDDAASLKVAYEHCRSSGSSCSLSEFYSEGLRRAGAGRAPGFLSAVSSWGDFDIFHLRTLLEAIPESYQKLISVKKSLRAAVLDACRREPTKIQRRGDWAFLPLERLDKEGVVPDTEVVQSILDGYAEQTDGLDADALFHILDSLATRLKPSEAAEALDYGLDLLNETLAEDRGDGDWSDSLLPPESCVAALAGYIWTGLGSPVTAERWQFAHVVRTAVELGWTELLGEVVVRANAGVGGPFADHRLEFYSWHARQWLLIGLARGVLAKPSLSEPCISHLWKELASRHVLIRAFAAVTLSSIRGARTDAEQAKLRSINFASLSEEVIEGWRDSIESEPWAEPLAEDAEDKYYFGIDIGPYWFAPLGRAFGLAEGAIERRALVALRTHMSAKGMSRGTDARYSRGILSSHDYETNHSHGSMPKTDDLKAYHSYHAMMLVAADLLELRNVRRASDESRNKFQEWLDDQLLTRASGMWLADRRDPCLVEKSPVPNGYAHADWCWSVTADYLDQQLLADDASHVLWGHWGHGKNSDEETVSVRSSLTPSDTAHALVAALQTASTDRFFLPSAERDWSNENKSSPLVGWVSSVSQSTRLDELDPWANGLAFPPTGPDADICSRMNLTPSTDGRRWTSEHGGELRSESWTRAVGYGREETSVSGVRLCADKVFIASMLAAHPGQSIVISVAVRRYPGNSAEREGLEPYPWPYQRFYLLDIHGITRAL